MDISELKKTHPEYGKRVADWKKWRAVYDGTDEIIAGGYFKQHERESDDNYQRRCDDALSYGLSKSIVDLFAQYLFLHPVDRDYGRLGNDDLFNAFLSDCDFQGNSVDIRFREDAKWAMVYGHVGYLVDRPQETSANRAEDLQNGYHPYLVRYFPEAILDWDFRREKGRLVLHYIKLYDSDGSYRLWWRDKWEAWRINDDGVPVLDRSGSNPLAEVPFVWLYSQPSPDVPGMSVSDMRELARFDLSIMQNISQGDEVITYAAFPMMIKPKERAGDEDEDESGPTAILEFNPEYPESRPSWLEAKVKEPLDAIGNWIGIKEQRAYKHVHATFVAGVNSDKAKSGVALKVEFTELGASLSRKAYGQQECEANVYRLCAKWQNSTWDGSVNYPTEFDMDELIQVLEDLLTARSLVPSQIFAREVAKRASRASLPGLPPETQEEIDKELDQVSDYNPPEE